MTDAPFVPLGTQAATTSVSPFPTTSRCCGGAAFPAAVQNGSHQEARHDDLSEEKQMSKTFKGAGAAIVAGVLLIGGAGSLAYWSDAEGVTGGSISSGELKL